MRAKRGKSKAEKRAKPMSRGRTVRARTKAVARSKKAKPPAKSKTSSKTAVRKNARVSKRSPARPKRKEELGEGNYTASREFRRGEEAFVRRNKNRIPAMGEEAEAALQGDEGGALLEAEERARSHSHSPGDER